MDHYTRLCTACLVAGVFALVGKPPVAPGAEGQPPTALTEADVHVDESAEAGELLAKVNRLAGQGQWAEAARLVQRASQQYGRSLTRLSPDRFCSVEARLQRMVAEWPAAGLRAYRRLEEDPASDAWSNSRPHLDLDHALQLLERFFCTQTGWLITDRAAQLAVEAGRLRLAAGIYQRFLATHPDRSLHDGESFARLAMVFALWGRAEESRSWQARAHDRLGADCTVEWLGQSIGLIEAVDQLLSTGVGATFQSVSEAATPQRIDSDRLESRSHKDSEWPVFGGNAARNAAPALPVEQPVPLWRHDYVDREAGADQLITEPGASRGLSRRAGTRPEVHGSLLSRFPVVAGGKVFIQDASRVQALDFETGRLLWSYGTPAARQAENYLSNDSAFSWHSPTHADGRLYAAMHTGNDSGDAETSSAPSHSVVCLDATTGALIWKLDSSRLGTPASEWSFDSSPLIDADILLITLRRRRDFGFEDCYLLRVDPRSGRPVFRTHLGGASTGGFGYQRPTVSILAADGDTAFVDTGLGSLAAVGMDTGSVRWLWVYPVPSRDPDSTWPRQYWGETRPWHFNPIILDGGRVYCLPLNGRALYVLDGEDGILLTTVPREQIADAHTIVGLRTGGQATSGTASNTGGQATSGTSSNNGGRATSDTQRLYGVGNEVFCYDLDRLALIWVSPLPVDEPLFGRSVLTRDGVAVPTQRSWNHYRDPDGMRVAQPWDAIDGEGGNLTVLPGRIVVAGQEHLAVYGPKVEVIAAAVNRTVMAPDDPLPMLDLAELAFRGGEPAMALDSLADAVERCGGFVQLVDPSLKRRIFDDCLQFAGALVGKPPVAPGDDEAARESAIQLYRYASQCPPDTAAHLTYRWRMAALHIRRNEPAEAARLYQQILTDRSLREAIQHTKDGDAIPAGRLAERKIAVLIDQFGRTIFSDADQAARRQLRLARRSEDPTAYDSLVQTFPNAEIAPQAWIEKGELLRRMGEPAAACRALYVALNRYRHQVNAPDLMRRIADCNVEARRPEVAWRWLTKAAREYPSARVDVDGVSVGLLDYRARLGDIRERVEPTRPAVEPPLTRPHQSQRAGMPARTLWNTASATILEPRLADRPGTDWSTLLIYSDDSIRAIDPTTGEDRWDEPVPCRSLPELLSATADRLILTTTHQVLVLDAATGGEVWHYGDYPLELLNPDADWESPTALRGHATDGARLVVFHADGTAACLDLTDGATIWQRVDGRRVIVGGGDADEFVAGACDK
ncbi:MAG: PQQ-binding-like beta-propeller repeat protein, partial [Planctomycetes bacterium]|nr:PQQ-binding-like beta-propeller repeat protein [Planctomycetota bacterium]